jgi:predicted CXXCH cytochrome family protein
MAWGRGLTAHLLRIGDELVAEMRDDGEPTGRHTSRYFLGHKRIEQHLVEFSDGKLQALPIGWDLGRSEWFDIFADDPREPRDWGHWTNRGMTANTQCLFCHTTGFVRGYDPAGDAYRTRWAEMAVGCEACHGARRAHVEERRSGRPQTPAIKATPAAIVDTCAPCHAVRRELRTGYEPGDTFLDFYEPLLLDDEGQFHADGTVRGESYEWASFLQSRMAQQAVSCVSCHDPHTGRLRRIGNALCLGCHEQRLGAVDHVKHEAGSAGAQCIACHMPVTVFMARDPRHDHSFSSPDPETTIEFGVPNACNGCHTDKDARWAADRVGAWYGSSPKRTARRALAAAFVGGRRRDAGSAAMLAACLRGEACTDAVRRASAARLLAPLSGESEALDALLAAAVPRETSALVRASALWALSEQDDPSRDVLLALQQGTGDAVRLARMNAAWGLRGIPADVLPPPMRTPLVAALDEWRAAMETQAEHPEAHYTLGIFFADQGNLAKAAEAYQAALRLAPDSVPARYNLATALAGQEDSAGAERELLRTLQIDPEFAPAAYDLGALRGRQGRWREAVTALTDCLKADPRYPGALSAIGRAYVELGETDVAELVLEAAVRYPGSEA